MLDSSFDETDNDSVIETTEVHGDHSYKLYRFSWWSYCIKKKKKNMLLKIVLGADLALRDAELEVFASIGRVWKLAQVDYSSSAVQV